MSGGEGGRDSCRFLRIGKSVCGLNSHLKCSFKRILEKKHPSFACRTWKIYRNASISKKLPLPRKTSGCAPFYGWSLWSRKFLKSFCFCNPTNKYMHKFNNRTLEKRLEYVQDNNKYTKTTSMTLFRCFYRYFLTYFLRFFSVFTVAFEQVDISWERLLNKMLLSTIYN